MGGGFGVGEFVEAAAVGVFFDVDSGLGEFAAVAEEAGALSADRARSVHSPLLANIALNFLDWKLHEAKFDFARYADEIVDDLASTLSDQEKAEHLKRWGDRFQADVTRGSSAAPVAASAPA